MKNLHFKTGLSLFILALVISFSFQNCGQGFKMAGNIQTASLEPAVAGTPAAPAPVPTADPALANLKISVPSGVNTLGMNLPAKIPVSVPAAAPGMSFVIRSRPASGTLSTPDAPSAAGSVIYSPSNNYLGVDSFIIAVMDSAGRVGADQRFDVRVDQKGIGQMIGTFVSSTCIPNTSALTATQTATETSYIYQQRGFSQDCVTPLYDMEMRGNHSVGAENVVLPTGVTVFEYNVTNKINTVKPLSAVAALTMSGQNFCGFNNWQANVVKDLSASGCSGYWAGPNVYMYRRLEIVGGEHRLYISTLNGGIGSTPATRTQGLTSFYMVKK